MPDAPTRHFTVEEANGLLDELRERLRAIRDARRVVLETAEMLERGATANGGGAEGSAALEAMVVLRREVQALNAEGIVLRDADTGLIDFPAQRDDRLIYLCWRPDEERVSHWHEVDAGFGGRRPL